MSKQFEIGNLVEAVPPYALACGSGLYRVAVVVQVTPLVLVSESGDMLWRAALYDGCVRNVGMATDDVREVALTRLKTVRNRGIKPMSEQDKTPGHWRN